MQYRREIDGLRSVAVIPVIFFHAGFESFSGGFVGVDVFFVISGYLITSIIIDDIHKDRFSIVRFYERRARRILPALCLVAALCIPAAWQMQSTKDMQDFTQSLFAVSTFLSNIFFWVKSDYFDPTTDFRPLIHTWSLSVEEQFYLLYPPFIVLLWARARRHLLAILGALAALSFASAVVGAHYAPGLNFFILTSRIWELMIGGMIAWSLQNGATVAPGGHRLLQEVPSLAGLALILFAVATFDETAPFPSFNALVPTLGTGLIIAFASERTLVGRVLGTPPLVAIGLISYSAYLWHQPIFVFAREYLLGVPSDLTYIALSVLSLALAAISWRYVERPFRARSGFSRRAIFAMSAVALVSLGGFGLAGHFTEGFLAIRYSAEDRAIEANLKAGWKARDKFVRGNVCQFVESGDIPAKTFIENYNCYDDAESATYRRIPVAVVGDSISADKVMALKTLGLLPLQIGGAGCSLHPSLMSRACAELFEGAVDIIASDNRIEYVALANYWTPDELDINAMREMLDYWSRTDKKLIFFSAMPRFYRPIKRIMRERYDTPSLDNVELSERPELKALLRKRDVHFVSTSAIYCASPTTCDMRDANGEFLLLDDLHLSTHGARYFGERLVRDDPLFNRIVGDLP